MSKGFYIKEVRVLGTNVAPASIIFEKGFNTVTGPSNTGKSYVFSCINFMLGGTDLPEEIDEAVGYTDLYMEIRDFEENAYTLKRSLKGGDFTKTNASIDQSFTRGESSKLKTKHSKDSDQNISRFLLSLMDVDLKWVKLNANNKKQTLSFRDIVNLTLVSEEKILTKKSPILGVSHANPTLSSSVLKFILTGKDAEELVEVEEKEIKKGKINAKIETINDFIDSLGKSYDALKIDSNIESRLGIINSMLNNMLKNSEVTSKQQEEAMKIRQEKWESLQKYESRLLMLNELRNRFNLLMSQYLSDLKRLDFIQEGEELITQLSISNCPICGSEFESNHPECFQQNAQIQESMNSEMTKIQLKLKDLKGTVSQMETEHESVTSSILNLKGEIELIEAKIEKELLPIRSHTKKEIDKLISEKDSLSQASLLKGKIDELAKERSKLQTMHDSKENAIDNINYTLETVTRLCEEIAILLNSWEYGKSLLVHYDESKLDILISNKHRKSNGKGYRSISFSAFIIGLLKYAVSDGKTHPKFVVLDSPLTAYKKKNSTYAKKDELTENIEEAFFKDLSKTPVNQQIIIFDNKEPNADVSAHFNHIPFTRNASIGRYGFFPVNS